MERAVLGGLSDLVPEMRHTLDYIPAQLMTDVRLDVASLCIVHVYLGCRSKLCFSNLFRSAWVLQL